MTKVRPIEIIGGGLAGLSLGLALRRAGVPVTLSDLGQYPRHRVCGEFITSLAESTITRLGLTSVMQDALHHQQVAWFNDGRQLCTQHLPVPARAMSRHRLDARLAHAFVAAGGRLHTQTRVPDRMPTAGCVIATGRRRSPSPWIGLKIHVCNLPLFCDLEVHLGEQTYVGLTRVEDNRVNLCGLFSRRELAAKGSALIIAYLRAAHLSALADRLENTDFDEASFCAVAALGFDQHLTASPGEVVLGDAGALIPPFTGNGMAMALQGAETALAPLLAYSRGAREWAETCQRIQLALHRRFRLRLTTAAVLHPFLLQRLRQRWLLRLAQVRLLPFRPLYAALH
ncbi:MAG: hypothetical protein Q8M02_07665 [Candidatus Didemnitutus sp.]|nr:hypothetical protein [Candidatus Didemnitutus sp.]